jgi:hypothetical protein
MTGNLSQTHCKIEVNVKQNNVLTSKTKVDVASTTDVPEGPI